MYCDMYNGVHCGMDDGMMLCMVCATYNGMSDDMRDGVYSGMHGGT